MHEEYKLRDQDTVKSFLSLALDVTTELEMIVAEGEMQASAWGVAPRGDGCFVMRRSVSLVRAMIRVGMDMLG